MFKISVIGSNFMNTVYELFDNPLLIWKKRIEVTQSFDGPAGYGGIQSSRKRSLYVGGGGVLSFQGVNGQPWEILLISGYFQSHQFLLLLLLVIKAIQSGSIYLCGTIWILPGTNVIGIMQACIYIKFYTFNSELIFIWVKYARTERKAENKSISMHSYSSSPAL